MVSNINLAAPEKEKKESMSSKGVLIGAISLVALCLLAFAFLAFLKSSLNSQKLGLEEQIKDSKHKMEGSNFSEVSDFQERLIIMKKMLNEHAYPELFLRNFSKYVLPEIRLTSFSLDNTGKKMTIAGIAPNFESFYKEIILLKSFPGVSSLEFKNATSTPASENSPGGVTFNIDAVLKAGALAQTVQ